MKAGRMIDFYSLSPTEAKKQLDEGLVSGALNDWEKQAYTFMVDWLSGRDQFQVRTSGSTGQPKVISISRNQMIASAERSLSAFGLQAGEYVLMALPPSTIAAIMMMVRAMQGRMRLILQDSRRLSLSNLPQPIHFAALVPLQVERLLADPTQLGKIRKLIIGGSALGHELRKRLIYQWDGQAWETYGMTETLSHVAIRKVNLAGEGMHFSALPGVSFEEDERNCLLITDAVLGIKELVTNDIVEILGADAFRWIGRWDDIINTGGIKVSPEEVEALLQPFIHVDFCISSVSDKLLGRRLLLVHTEPLDNSVLQEAYASLDAYKRPKEAWMIDAIPRNENGKIDRRKLVTILDSWIRE